MKDKKVLEEVKIFSANVANQKSLKQFRKMQQFIDSSIQNAIALDGPEKVSTLVTTLLSLRDFLTSDILENSFKLNLLKSIQSLEIMEDEEGEESEEVKQEKQEETIVKAPPPVIKKKESEQDLK